MFQTLLVVVGVFMAVNGFIFMRDSVKSKKMYAKDPTLADEDVVKGKITSSGLVSN